MLINSNVLHRLPPILYVNVGPSAYQTYSETDMLGHVRRTVMTNNYK